MGPPGPLGMKGGAGGPKGDQGNPGDPGWLLLYFNFNLIFDLIPKLCKRQLNTVVYSKLDCFPGYS